MEDMITQEQTTRHRRNQAIRAIIGEGFISKILRLFVHSSHIIFDYFKYLLPFSIFFFKFLEWWYAENRVPSQTLPIPPPPKALPKAKNGLELPDDKNLCPICQHPRTNLALLVSSGYVFCYPCIHNFVEKNKCCPVTRTPSTIEQIRRIYEAK